MGTTTVPRGQRRELTRPAAFVNVARVVLPLRIRPGARAATVSPATSVATEATRRPACTTSMRVPVDACCRAPCVTPKEDGSRVHNVLFRDEPRWRTTTPRNDTARDDSREHDHCATMAELLDLETLDVGFVDASQSCRGLSRQQQVSSSAPRFLTIRARPSSRTVLCAHRAGRRRGQVAEVGTSEEIYALWLEVTTRTIYVYRPVFFFFFVQACVTA